MTGADWGSREQVLEALRGHESFVLFLHLNPDGDSIGSSLGLGLALERLGKRVAFAYSDFFPRSFRFLEGSDRFRHWREIEGHFDAAVALDCSAPDRVGDARALAERCRVLINVDHHPTNPGFGDYRWVEPDRSCVGEMVFELVQALGVPLEPAVAYPLFTAIVTDTGSFRYEQTTATTLRYAAALVDAGVRPERVALALFESRTPEAIRLLRGALATLRLDAGDRLAWMVISRALLAETGARAEDAEGLINYARSIEPVELAVLFFEEPDGRVRVSFRSKSRVDVGELAARFGGGGHARAAGCQFPGPLPTVEQQVLEAARAALAAAGAGGM